MCAQYCTVGRFEVCYCVREKCDVRCYTGDGSEVYLLLSKLEKKIISDDLKKKKLIRSIVLLVTLERRQLNTLVHQYALECFSERGPPFASLSDGMSAQN